MVVAEAAPGFALHVDPALAEAAVFRALSRLDLVASEALAAHRRRTELVYAMADPAERGLAFGRLALAEFAELCLAEPLRVAVAERPAVAARARVVLLGEARGRLDEGVTCEPGGEHLGIRIEATWFDDPGGLLAWARHALGHAEDTLDPAFAFERDWDEAGGGRVPVATRARLHRLWDVTVDARLVAAGRLVAGPALRRHRAAIAGDLPGIGGAAIDVVVAYLWERPRPAFPELLAWAERPIGIVRVAAPGEPGLPRPDRCPLCGFPSDDVIPPEAEVAELVAVDYPDWRPERGLCGRCTDRYRFAGLLGGGR